MTVTAATVPIDVGGIAMTVPTTDADFGTGVAGQPVLLETASRIFGVHAPSL
jgi:hypothetical protein